MYWSLMPLGVEERGKPAAHPAASGQRQHGPGELPKAVELGRTSRVSSMELKPSPNDATADGMRHAHLLVGDWITRPAGALAMASQRH